MATLKSFDLNGKKLSFANWVSTLSPEDSLFVSMIGKESIDQALFQWQSDTLNKATKNAYKEGGKASGVQLRSTRVHSNVTQILRKVVKVSDTVEHVATFGRGNEMKFQMEKAGKEIKRDLEWAFLHQTGALQGDHRRSAGFRGLVAPIGVACQDTGAVTHKALKRGRAFDEESIFDLTYNLYMAGSTANIIMFHPVHAEMFSMLQESYGGKNEWNTKTRKRFFENTDKIDVQVTEITDPLGQVYTLLPNRWMPQGSIYFFNPDDFTQMILRAPEREKLAKDGSYEKWMLEMETGLRIRHPYAAGVLSLAGGEGVLFDGAEAEAAPVKDLYPTMYNGAAHTVFTLGEDSTASFTLGEKLEVKFKIKRGADDATTPVNIVVLHDGYPIGLITSKNADQITHKIVDAATENNTGNYQLIAYVDDGFVMQPVDVTTVMELTVKAPVVPPEPEPNPSGR